MPTAPPSEPERGHHLPRCDCSRQQPGARGCRVALPAPPDAAGSPVATRLAVPCDRRITFRDRIQGQQDVSPGRELPDFVVRRRDGLHAHQLAVVVDDAGRASPTWYAAPTCWTPPAARFCCNSCWATAPLLRPPAGHHRCRRPQAQQQTHAPPLQDDRVGDNLRCAALPPATTPLEAKPQISGRACANWRPEAVPAVLASTGCPPGDSIRPAATRFTLESQWYRSLCPGGEARQMYINRLLLLAVGVFMIFLPLSRTGYSHPARPGTALSPLWLLVVVAAYLNQRTRYPDELLASRRYAVHRRLPRWPVRGRPLADRGIIRG